MVKAICKNAVFKHLFALFCDILQTFRGFAKDSYRCERRKFPLALLFDIPFLQKSYLERDLNICKITAYIHVEYEVLTDKIINRQGAGVCPMEQTVEGVEEARECYEEILKRLLLCANRQRLD